MSDAILLSREQALDHMDTLIKYIKVAHATGYNETSMTDLLGKILVGNIQAWVGLDDNDEINCVGTTEFLQYPNYKALHLITLGGEAGVNLVKLHKPIEAFAREQGCKCVMFWGRKAWERASVRLEGDNGEKYKETYRVFAMELENHDIQ
jgi:hypothetical protein